VSDEPKTPESQAKSGETKPPQSRDITGVSKKPKRPKSKRRIRTAPALNAPAPIVPRDDKGRIAKGHSLNPGGRPRSVLSLILEIEQRNGRTVVERIAEFAYGLEPCTSRDQLDAARWLAERKHGKTPDIVLTGAMNAEQQAVVQELTREQLLALAETNGLPRPARLEVIDVTPVLSSETGATDGQSVAQGAKPSEPKDKDPAP
jgi:hypothetical protein